LNCHGAARKGGGEDGGYLEERRMEKDVIRTVVGKREGILEETDCEALKLVTHNGVKG